MRIASSVPFVPRRSIVLAYNAEMRGLANYYQLANCAKYSLRKLHFLWQASLLKTLSFKLRRSVNQVAHHLKIGVDSPSALKPKDGVSRGLSRSLL